MTVITPINEEKVNDFSDFCNLFNINSNKKAGKDGFDEELIEEELRKIRNKKWIISFIENKNDGFFLLQQIR